MAWTHHDEPELFEEFEGDSATVRAAKRLQRRDELLAVEHPLPTSDVMAERTPEAIREEYECIAQDVDGASIQMQRVVNDDSPIDRGDIDEDLKELREQVRRLESLREHVPEPKPATPQDG